MISDLDSHMTVVSVRSGHEHSWPKFAGDALGVALFTEP